MKKEKIRIFIVSSLDALTLARSLREDLTTDFSEAHIWSGESDRRVSRTIIEMPDEAGKYDFAVIILTKKALLGKDIGDKEEQRARDDCFYKSGLFMGDLGHDRCFLVSSGRKSELPVDLSGINYLYFNEPDDLADHDQCKKALGEGSTEITKLVRQRGGKIRQASPPLLSYEEILKKERLDKGDLKKSDQKNTIVMVFDTLPIESFAWAIQIKENLDNGVKYFYFFHAEANGARRICRLLQMIMLADSLKNDLQKGESFQDCYEKIKEYKDQVIKNLEKICEEDSLNIYFIPVEHAFNFRVYNAGSPKYAKVYLRYGNSFVDWSGSGTATSTYNSLQRFEDPYQKDVVFCSNEFYNLDNPGNAEFRSDLEREITLHFPDIDDTVKQKCGLKLNK
jgi:hypothetical protein